MDDLIIREIGQVGWITLNRPKSLNALTHEMILEIERNLDLWLTNEDINVIIIDAKGEKAFCAGGDITEMYKRGMAGDLEYGRKFWQDEYRLNAKIKYYPKSIASFLNGYTMGGGVGIGCHAEFQIIGKNSKIAMPECSIGLIPDVGGSSILSNANFHLGEYFGLTGKTMNPYWAMVTGFATYHIDEKHWDDVKADIVSSGHLEALEEYTTPPQNHQKHSADLQVIDQIFGQDTLGEIEQALLELDTEWSTDVIASIHRNSPLSVACTFAMIRMQKRLGLYKIEDSLEMEFRFTARSVEHSDFIEGIRAQIIDKDFKPKWKHSSFKEVDDLEVAFMLGALHEYSLDLGDWR